MEEAAEPPAAEVKVMGKETPDVVVTDVDEIAKR